MTLDVPRADARPHRARPRHAVLDLSARPVARLGVRPFSARRHRVSGRRRSAPPPLPRGASAAPTRSRTARNDDADLAGLREFQRGDPPQRVAWKAVARGAGWFSKEFDGAGGGGPVTLDVGRAAAHRSTSKRGCRGSPPGCSRPSAPRVRSRSCARRSRCPRATGPRHRRAALTALATVPAGRRRDDDAMRLRAAPRAGPRGAGRSARRA